MGLNSIDKLGDQIQAAFSSVYSKPAVMPAMVHSLGCARTSGLCLTCASGTTRKMQVSIVRCSASSGQAHERTAPSSAKVIGMGGCGVDYLAQVAAYPRPDEKLRTEKLEVQGGGNCGNALTAAARLGLCTSIVSKIGGDSLGDGIIGEFQRDTVDTAHLLRAAGAPSPFTYIIVDRQGGTRTCIHTPSEPMTVEEMSPELAAKVLGGAALLYFDGRLTEPALKLAAAARAAGVSILVEGERLRPHLDELLTYADYVVTSAHFPQEWTGEGCVGDAILSTFHRLPNAKWMVTTLGARGSVLMERLDPAADPPPKAAVLEDLLQGALPQPHSTSTGAAAAAAAVANGSPPACVSSSGVEIWEGGVLEEQPYRLWLQRGGPLGSGGQEAAVRQAAAAQRAAASNADAGNAAGYSGGGARLAAQAAAEELVARVSVAQAAKLPSEAVLDTTGAGDSFIGSMLYSLATGQPLRDALRLAAVVAACNCTALGARTGMPRRDQIRADLL